MQAKEGRQFLSHSKYLIYNKLMYSVEILKITITQKMNMLIEVLLYFALTEIKGQTRFGA